MFVIPERFIDKATVLPKQSPRRSSYSLNRGESTMLVSSFVRLNMRRNIVLSAKTQVGFQSLSSSRFVVRCYTSRTSEKLQISAKEDSFTVNYLVQSCGLSVESAKFVSRNVRLKSPEKADSLLSLLKKRGFTESQVSKIVRSKPQLLLLDADRIVLPKLEFFCSTGLANPDLAVVITKNPLLLTFSLKERIIPGYAFLKSVLLRDDLVIKAMVRSRVLLQDVEKVTVPNISVLRQMGMPQSSIIQVLKRRPTLLCAKIARLEEKLKKVIDMGFSPVEKKFVDALAAYMSQSELSLQRKIEVYKRCGWSEDDVLLAFRKRPICMTLSEKKIVDTIGFLVNKMELKPSDIARCPALLSYSLKNRMIPRSSVIKWLQLKHMIKKDISLDGVFQLSDQRFMDNYLTRYKDHLPHLIDVFQENVSLQELGFHSNASRRPNC